MPFSHFQNPTRAGLKSNGPVCWSVQVQTMPKQLAHLHLLLTREGRRLHLVGRVAYETKAELLSLSSSSSAATLATSIALVIMVMTR